MTFSSSPPRSPNPPVDLPRGAAGDPPATSIDWLFRSSRLDIALWDRAAGKQDLLITREFDLPVELLFKAYAEPELIEQWMGTRVLKHESKKHGSYRFQTSYQGNVVFQANGVIHEFNPNKRIVRTFEMENEPFGVQLEVLEFERLSMAHDRLQEIVSKSK